MSGGDEPVAQPAPVDHDAIYAAIARAHRGLDEAESAALNARLVLILADRIGDARVIADAVALARQAR